MKQLLILSILDALQEWLSEYWLWIVVVFAVAVFIYLFVYSDPPKEE